MEDSILQTIRVFCNVDKECEDFDTLLIPYINAAFMTLVQLGIGPKDGYRISDDGPAWSDYISETDVLDACITYIGNRVRLRFDPPTNATVIASLKEVIAEAEWRLIHHVEVERSLAQEA